MRTLAVNELKPGMVLAKEARDRNGRLLLGEGLELDANHIRVLKSWGVTQAFVEGGEEEAAPQREIPPEIRHEAVKRVKQRFRHADWSDLMVQALMRLGVQQLAERMMDDPELMKPPPEQPPPESEPARRGESIDPYRIIHDNTELASLPTIFAELVEAVNDPRSSAATLSRVVSKDTALAARLLKLVNSPFYGFPQKIDTISRAVTILGSRQLTMLALGVAAVDMFRDVPEEMCTMDSFWRHSIAVGVGARMLAVNCNIPNTERLFVAGLLHDVGRLVIYKHLASHARDILALSQAEDISLRAAEVKVLGFDHSRLGGILLREWKLPPTLENIVRHHHKPEKAHSPREPALVQLANVLAYTLDLGATGEQRIPNLAPGVVETTGVEPASLKQITPQIFNHYQELTRLIVENV
jgi:HD-like signal output (HDOD) protein